MSTATRKALLGALALSTGIAAPLSAQDAPEAEARDIRQAEAILAEMRTDRLNRHSCGQPPRFPSNYSRSDLERLASRSERWYACLADHVQDLQYEAEETQLRLESALVNVPLDHDIWPRVARTIEAYNRRAGFALDAAQTDYDRQRDRAQRFVERVKKQQERQRYLARLQYGLECASEQAAAATYGITYNAYGYPTYTPPSPAILDTEGCIERKMAGIPTSPYDYYPAYNTYTPSYYYVPDNEVHINVDISAYGDIPAGTHVDVGVTIPDDHHHGGHH